MGIQNVIAGLFGFRFESIAFSTELVSIPDPRTVDQDEIGVHKVRCGKSRLYLILYP